MRVVITGLGVVAPNGVGLEAFLVALREGKSGIQFWPQLKELNFACQIGGAPSIKEEVLDRYLSPLERKTLEASGIIYGLIAGMEAWQSAGFDIPENKEQMPDWDTGCVFGSGLAGAEVMRNATYLIDQQKVKRLGSTAVPQVMSSGVSAYLGGKLGLGNQVSTNAAACSTGTESILIGYDRIRLGKAKRMICGGCDSSGPYVWGGFDAMRVTNRKDNDHPEKASRPMSATAKGFVPGGGAGALVLEDYESAMNRGATIYGEVLGGFINSGGQQNKGSMTAPNSQGIIKCIQGALNDSDIQPGELDGISGHLTSTLFDPQEILNWSIALDRKGKRFPHINALKSMIGHCLSAAGAIESVAVVLQLMHGFLHPSLNCEDLHPEIHKLIDEQCIPQQMLEKEVQIIAKSSFGFGDVNSCVIFKKY